MKRFDFDTIVIGSGDAGGTAALQLARAGQKVGLIEADRWGGSGVNYSDVPLGALIEVAQNLKTAKRASVMGLSSLNLRYNFPTVNNWKNLAARRAGANNKKPFEDAGITCIHGRARFLSNSELCVGSKTFTARKFLIATGASILDTGVKIPENVDYFLPDTIGELTRVPKSAFVVGGGASGCEIAQYLAALGSEVVVADIAGRLLPREDEEVGQVLDSIFNRDGIRVLTQSRVVAVEKVGLEKRVIFMRGGQEKSVCVDEVVFCTGSAPNTDLGLENTSIKFDRNGIKVDSAMRTNAKHIFAAGDVVGGHSAPEKVQIEARVAAAHIVGRSKVEVDYGGIVRNVRLLPAVACIGSTEDDCLRQGRKFQKIALPINLTQKSFTSGADAGLIKLICDRSHRILGASLVMPQADLAAQELSLAIHYAMSLEEIIHAPHSAQSWSALIQLACERLAARG